MGVCMLLVPFGIVAIVLIILKIYVKLSAGWTTSYTCLVGKTVLITGANTGLGYYTAMEMAKRGARVIMACRNLEKANEARDKIINETDNQNVVVKIVDMASLDSIREFAGEICGTVERLDILINNAGAIMDAQTTKDGLDMLMQINHFGPFLLTLLLIDLLKKSAPSRIINVSSEAAKYAKLDPNNLNNFPGKLKMYARTKLCNILFTQELAKRLDGTNVTTYSLHPGAVKTDIIRDLSPIGRFMFSCLEALAYKSTEEGAQTQIHLAVAKGIEHLSGRHFSDCKVVTDYKSSRDPKLAKLVWEKCEKYVRLTEEEKRI